MADKTDAAHKYTYLGPAHYLEHEGRLVQPGDSVSMTEAQARDLQRRGHHMGGLEGGQAGVRYFPDAAPMQEGNARQRQALDDFLLKGDAPEGLTPAQQLQQDASGVAAANREAAQQIKEDAAAARKEEK